MEINAKNSANLGRTKEEDLVNRARARSDKTTSLDPVSISKTLNVHGVRGKKKKKERMIAFLSADVTRYDRRREKEGNFGDSPK